MEENNTFKKYLSKRVDETEGFWPAAEQHAVLACELAEAKEAYRLNHARAFSESLGKTEALRNADADIQTSTLRLERDIAQVRADYAYHIMISLRGSAGEASR